jgi:hypothetical protein
MDNTPQPSGGRADESLLKIPAYELEEQRSSFHKIAKEMTAGKSVHQLNRLAGWGAAVSRQLSACD